MYSFLGLNFVLKICKEMVILKEAAFTVVVLPNPCEHSRSTVIVVQERDGKAFSINFVSTYFLIKL